MRFKSKRTIPGKHKKLFFYVKSFLVLSIFAVLVSGITRTALLLIEKGPAIIEKKIQQATKRNVSLKKISLHFPNIITLHDFAIKSRSGKENEFSAGKIECRYSWRCILGIAEITAIKLIQPAISLQRINKEFNLSVARVQKTIRELNTDHTQGEKISFDPLQWPLVIKLQTIAIQDGLLHLTDIQKRIPELNATIDLDLKLQQDALSEYPLSGTILVKQSQFSHRGLAGSMTGKIDLLRNLASSQLSLTFTNKEQLLINGAIRDYRSKPAIHFFIESNQLSMSHFDKLNFPFLPAADNMLMTGTLQLNNLTMYGHTFPSLTGQFKYAPESLLIEKMELELPGHVGMIKGSINFGSILYQNVPPLKIDNIAKIQFQYNGDAIATNILGEKLYGHFDLPFPAIQDLASDVRLRITQGSFIITSVILNTEKDSLVLEGESDLSFKHIDLNGKFMVSVHEQIIAENNIIAVSIKGPLSQPQVIFSN